MVREQRPIPCYTVSCGETAACGLSPLLSEGHPPAGASTLCLVATDFLEMGHPAVCAAERGQEVKQTGQKGGGTAETDPWAPCHTCTRVVASSGGLLNSRAS